MAVGVAAEYDADRRAQDGPAAPEQGESPMSTVDPSSSAGDETPSDGPASAPAALAATLARLQDALADLSAPSGEAQAEAGARLLAEAARAWLATTAAAVPPIHAQLPGPAVIAVGERGPVVVAAAAQAKVDLAAALDDHPGLEPGIEHEVTGELTVVRPHPDLESRWILQPRAEGSRWRVLTVQRREG